MFSIIRRYMASSLPKIRLIYYNDGYEEEYKPNPDYNKEELDKDKELDKNKNKEKI